MFAQRSGTPPPRQRAGSHLLATPKAIRKQSLEDGGFQTPSGFQTPGLKGGKRQLFDDECSTAAPSPWIGRASPSPWPTPDFRLESPCVERRPPQRVTPLPQWQPTLGGFSAPTAFTPSFFEDMSAPTDCGGFALVGFDSGFDDTFGASALLPLELEATKEQLLSTPAPVIGRGPPDAPWQLPRPPLLRALERDSLEEARAALDSDADAAKFPFWDHHVEPPLCAAARLGCGAEMLALLLARGADARAVDTYGRTPLDMAQSDDVKGLLADAGAVATLGVEAPATEAAGDYPFKAMTWSDVEEVDPFSGGWSCPPPAIWSH